MIDIRLAPLLRANSAAIRAVSAALLLRPPYSIYLGVLGHANLGDEILWHLAKNQIAVQVLQGGVDYGLQRAALSALAKRGASILIGGGTLLLSQPFERALSPLLRRHLTMATFGSGVLDPTFWGGLSNSSRANWVAICRACELLGVRSQRGVEILSDLGITHAEPVGDPALLYTTDQPAISNSETIGVNVGTAHGRVWGGDEQGPMKEVVTALRHFSRRGWKIRLFIVWPRDRDTTLALAQRVGVPKDQIFEEFHNARAFQSQVQRCHIFLGTKLHSVVLGAACGVPTVALGYRPKVGDFMNSIGAASQCIRWDQLTSTRLIDLMQETIEHSNEVGKAQWFSCSEMKCKFETYMVKLRTLIEARNR